MKRQEHVTDKNNKQSMCKQQQKQHI